MSLEHALATFVLMLVAQVPIVIAAVVAYIRAKAAIAENTKVTKEGSEKAVTNAKVAADTAKEAKNSVSETKQAVENINKKLNGGLDKALSDAISPIQEALTAHTKQDTKDMEEVKKKFETLSQYVRDRNHDIIEILQKQSITMESILKKTEPDTKK